MDLSALFPSWLAHVPLGWIVVAVLVLVLTVDAMRSGPGRACVLALASPVSIFLFSLIPHTFMVGKMLAPLSTSTVMAAAFLIVFVVAFLLIYRMTATFGSSSGGFLFSLLAGASGTIALIVMWLQIPSLVALWSPGSQISTIFGLPYALLWLLGIYLVLAFMRS